MTPVGFQLLRPTGAGSPDAHTPVRSAPTPMDWSWRELRTDAHGWSGTRGASRRGLRACEVSPGWTAPHIVGQRLPRGANRCDASPERGPSVDRSHGPRRPQPGSRAFVHRRRRRRSSAGADRRDDRPMRAVLGAVVLARCSSCLAGSPARRSAAPDDPVGVWPLDPEPDVVRRFEPPPRPLRRRPPRRRPRRARPARRCAPRCRARSAFAGSIGGKPVVTVLHGGRRTTYEPVVASVERGQAVAAGERAGPPRGHRQPLLPRRLPALGPDRGRRRRPDYLDPLSPRRRRTGAAAAAVARRAGDVRLPWTRRWTGPRWTRWRRCPRRLRCVRSMPVDTGRSLRRGGGPAGRPGAAGRS